MPVPPASPDPLDAALEQSRGCAPELAASLRDEIWRRIADAEERDDPVRLRERIEAIAGQPAFAAAFVAACIVFGLFLAELRLSRAAVQRNHALAREYVRLIDPRIHSLVTPSARTPAP
jgi:hypothetical protein